MKITFKFAEGQLVKLQEDRPEEAYALTDVPTEFLREYCVWNDGSGDYAEADRFRLLGTVLDWYENDLCAELNMYCDAQELPHLSADELILEPGVSDEQRAYLSDYCDRWEAMVSLYYVLNR